MTLHLATTWLKCYSVEKATWLHRT